MPRFHGKQGATFPFLPCFHGKQGITFCIHPIVVHSFVETLKSKRMALENLISLQFTEDELTQLDQHLTGIRQLLKGKTINLTSEQRQQYGRIANQNKLIVDKAKNYMEQHPDWLPRFVDKKEFDSDYLARQQIESRVQALEQLSQQLIDTKTLLDHDNYTNSLSFYRMVRYLAGENEPSAKSVYEDMKVLFNKTTASKNEPTPSATSSSAY